MACVQMVPALPVEIWESVAIWGSFKSVRSVVRGISTGHVCATKIQRCWRLRKVLAFDEGTVLIARTRGDGARVHVCVVLGSPWNEALAEGQYALRCFSGGMPGNKILFVNGFSDSRFAFRRLDIPAPWKKNCAT